MICKSVVNMKFAKLCIQYKSSLRIDVNYPVFAQASAKVTNVEFAQKRANSMQSNAKGKGWKPTSRYLLLAYIHLKKWLLVW